MYTSYLSGLAAAFSLASAAQIPPVAERSLASRDSTATFPLEWSAQNDTLFTGRVGGSVAGVALAVECVDCWTHGSVTASLTDADVYKPHVRLEFNGVSGHFDMDVTTTGIVSYTVELYKSETPFGISFDGFDAGLVFFVELPFVLSDKLDFKGGFEIDIPDGSYTEISIFDSGDVADSNFDGTTTTSLPASITAGNATFKADVRVRAQIGVESSFLHTGAVAAIYANLAEFEAELTSTDDCEYAAEEWFDINVGAYVSVGGTAGYATISYAPTASTTLWSSPTETQCLDGIVGITPTITPTPAAAIAAHAQEVQNAPVETYTIVKCNAPVVNCPASLKETVVATGVPKASLRENMPVNIVHINHEQTFTLAQIPPKVETFNPAATA